METDHDLNANQKRIREDIKKESKHKESITKENFKNIN